MTVRLHWTLAASTMLALHGGAAVADDDFILLHPRICERSNLSGETRAWCDSIEGLSGRDLYRATARENLR